MEVEVLGYGWKLIKVTMMDFFMYRTANDNESVKSGSLLGPCCKQRHLDVNIVPRYSFIMPSNRLDEVTTL